MLKNVWKCKKTTFFGDDIPDVLYSRTILLTSEYFRKPFMVFLPIEYVQTVWNRRLLAEGKDAFGNVKIVIVVECRRTNVLVL
jgi:hypothetical protein